MSKTSPRPVATYRCRKGSILPVSVFDLATVAFYLGLLIFPLMRSYLNRIGSDLGFTDRQIKFIATLSVTAAIMGAVIVVKNISERAPTPPPLNVSVAEPDHLFTGLFIVDPNLSPADSLELLPGIGSVLADRIVEYRRKHRFESEVDIINVSGIGPRLFEKIKPYLKVHQL